jgi:hypothetical protein
MLDVKPPTSEAPDEPDLLARNVLLDDLLDVVSALIAAQTTIARTLAETARALAETQEDIARLSALAEAEGVLS